MAIKISDLTSASALGGTEQVPLVQSGVTKKGLVSQIGTYVRGLFTATPATIAEGGTGAATAAGARTNLGVDASGTALLKTLLTAKGSLVTASAASTPLELVVGTNGQSVRADSSQTSGQIWTDFYDKPNLLINPNWQIDQINEGGLYTFVSASTVYAADGWSMLGTGAGVYKTRTVVDPDNAALKCLEITCTTADAAIVSTDVYYLYTAVEGYDAASLMWGTASALPVTLQFKFKTNVTGVYGVALQNSAATRRYVSTITVSNTSENEYSITVPGDTSGTWLYTNGAGLTLTLTLAGGSNFQTTAGSWGASAVLSGTTASQCNFMSSTSNIAYLKRIQLIPGALVQAYRPADIEKELAKAQRYYAKTYNQGTVTGTATNVGAFYGGNFATNGQPSVTWNYPRTMRATPTLQTWSNAGTLGSLTDGAGASQASTTLASGDSRAIFYVAVGPGTAVYGHAAANARLS